MDEKAHLLKQFEHKMAQINGKGRKEKNALDTVFMLFSLFFEQFTETASIGFTTLFSRIAFFGVHHNLPGYLIYETQQFRRILESEVSQEDDIGDLVDLGLHLIQANALKVHSYSWTQVYEKPDKIFNPKKSSALGYTRVAKAVLFSVSENKVEVVLEEVPEIKQFIPAGKHKSDRCHLLSR